MKTLEQHQEYVRKIAEQIKNIANSENNKRINFIHGSTNSTRTEENNDFAFVDISDLDDVLEINTEDSYALVEPNVSLDKLLRATLRHNLIPQVIAEFPGITVGGAINGASAESSSFRYGQFNDTAEAYEMVLGNGQIITASKEENSDLFYGVVGSYGTLALLTTIKLRLVPAKPYVRLSYEPLSSFEEVQSVLLERCRDADVEYAEALLFDKSHGVVISGRLTDEDELPVQTFAHAHDPWFYQEAERVSKSGEMYYELVPIADYIFRYNRGAFWMGEYALSLLHFPHHRLMRFILNPWMNTRKLYDALHATNLSQDYFIQDLCLPADRVIEFLNYSEEKLGVYPLWLCPMKPTQEPQKLSPHYIQGNMLIDVGIWGQSERYLRNPIELNKEFESYTASIGGRKVLYAHAYYSREDFWGIYDYPWYKSLREKYHATKAFPEIWEKVHVESHSFEHHMVRGAIKLMLETFEGKHLGT